MSERTARTAAACAIALIAIGAIALLCVAYLDMRTLASRYGADGRVSAIFLDELAHRARNCALVVLAIAAAAFAYRARIAEELRALPRPTLPRMTIPALIIAATGTVARIVLLDGPLHWDEAYTFNEFVRRPALDFLTRYAHPNNHLFHTLLAHAVHVLGGDSRWSLRLPAFLAGVGVLVAVYVLTRRMAGENAALLALALAAGASPLVEYSAQGRGYTIVALATLLLFRVRAGNWLLAVILAALGAWTIPVMLFPFAAWIVWLLLDRVPLRRVAAILTATGALTFLLYVPVLVVSGAGSFVANGTTRPLPLREVSAALPASMAETLRDWTASFPIVLSAIVAAGVLLAIVLPAQRRLLLACTIAPIALTVALRVVPFPRIWVPFLPLFLILAASGLVRERWPRNVVSAIAIALTLFLGWTAVRATSRPTFFEDATMADVPRLADFLRASLPPDTAILVRQPLDQPLAFEVRDPRVIRSAFDTDPARVAAALGAYPHAWAVLTPGHAPRRIVRRFPLATVSEIR